MQHAGGHGLRTIAVVVALFASLAALPSQTAGGSEVTMALYARFDSPRGWSTSPGAEAEPGPTIVVDVGDNVTLSLTSEDGRPHVFWVDYDDGSGAYPDIDPDEPRSPAFSTTAVTYTFMARREGRFTYYCALHYPAMFGTFVARAPPVIILSDFYGGTSLTGGVPREINFDLFDASPPEQITLWLNYSYGSGANRGTIAGPIPGTPNPNTVPWTPPRIDATDVVVNVTAIDPDGKVGYFQTPSFQIDSTPPVIVSSFPAPGAADVSAARIQVEWSEQMDWTATLSSAAFGLRKVVDGVWVLGEFGLFAVRELTFTPEAPLAPAAEYEAVINASAKDASRPVNPAMPTSWRFTTAADATPPVISEASVSPAQVSLGQSVLFTVTASDDRAVFRVYVHIVGPDTDVNLSLSEDMGRWSISWPFETPGTYAFTTWAVDTAGNYASRSGSFQVIVPSGFDPLPFVALGILAVAIAASTFLWNRRRRGSRGSQP